MYSKTDHKFWLLPLIISIFGMVILFLATPHGMGLSPDSVSYIQGSRFLVEDHSLNRVSSHWPPGYPLLVAFFSLPLDDYLLSARIVGVVAFGGNLLLFGLLLRKSGWNYLFVSIFAILLIIDPDFLNIQLMAWSEPVFLLFLQLGLLALLDFWESGSKKHLIIFGTAFGLCSVVRYAGIAFIASGLFLLIVYLWKKKEIKILNASPIVICFLVSSLFPILIWLFYKPTTGSQSQIRKLVFHAITQAKWQEGQNTIINWFGGAEEAIIFFIIIGGILIMYHRNLSLTAKRLLGLSASLLITYFVFITFSILYFDAYIPLDNRILSPAKILIYLIIISSFQSVIEKWKFMVVGVFAVFAATLNFSDTRQALSNSSINGVGFAATKMQNMPILSVIKENHIEIDATNSPEIVLLYLNQEVPMLPKSFDPTTRLSSVEQPSELAKLAKSRNTVVIFNALLWRDYLPKPRQLMELGFTNIVYQGTDGLILQYP